MTQRVSQDALSISLTQIWQTLPVEEHQLLIELSVFRGGFTWEAAQSVADVSLEAFPLLVEKQYIVLENGTQRYYIPEALRRFGIKLGGETAVRQRHAHYYHKFLQTLHPLLRTAQQPQAITAITAEWHNIRTAWQWNVTQRNFAFIEKDLTDICYYLDLRSLYKTAHALLRETIVQLPQLKQLDTYHLLGQMLLWYGYFEAFIGDDSEQSLKRSLAYLRRSLRDTRRDEGFVLIYLGRQAMQAGIEQEALDYQHQALSLFKEIDDEWGMTFALDALGRVKQRMGAYDEAMRVYQVCLTMRRSLGDPTRLVQAMRQVGALALLRGEQKQGDALIQESLELLKTLSSDMELARTKFSLTNAYTLTGQFEQAYYALSESLELVSRLDARRLYIRWTVMRSNILVHMGHYHLALEEVNSQLEQVSASVHYNMEAGLAAMVLSQIFLAQNQLKEAHQWGWRSVILFGQNRQRALLGQAMATWAYTNRKIGEHGVAQARAFEGLYLSTQIKDYLTLMSLLPVIALLLADDGEWERAIELLALAQTQTFMQRSKWFSDVVLTELSQMTSVLEHSQLQAARVRGSGLDLWETAAVLLLELPARQWQMGTVQPSTSSSEIDGARYELGEMIAEGSMGHVYVGHDRRTGERVAIKQLKPVMANDPEQVMRFLREAETLRQLNHPNIVQMIDAFEEAYGHVIVMEYVGGGTLRDLLNRTPQLPVSVFLALARELADALAQAHSLKIIHRDLKPANILLSAKGQKPYLTDFGIARLDSQGDTLTRLGELLGTLSYMSPEACLGKRLDKRSDIWSFGVMLYEMLAGERPFIGDNILDIHRAIMESSANPLELYRADVPIGLERLILSMLHKERESRVLTMAEIVTQLTHLQKTLIY